ncbi:hypothetical protein OIO90_002264 [Microbotryomycetes sp. JL221]|nr:hypothetical protein OIO90_002264 [Microbotryomycetes sp. JL221]
MLCQPPAADGVVGKLTEQQEKDLKAFWKEFLQLIDEAPEQGAGPKGKGSADSAPKNEKDAGKDIPKDDNAKERMKAEEERRNAEAAFAEYGSIRFMDAFWRFVSMDDPDTMILRFARARKWKVSAGVAMLASCIKWRMDSDVEKIFEKGEEGMKDAEGFLMQLSSGKTYTQGTDYYGRPVEYIHVRLHKTSDQSPKALEDFVLFQMESIRCMLADGADKVTIVFDMTGFGIRNMDWRCILFIVKCLEAYYPESLNVMIIHNAPWVFQGIWKVLGPMLDPVVRNKIFMSKNEKDLLEYIPKNHLVKQLGGANDWEWKYPDVISGENEKQKDHAERKKLQKQRDELIAQYLEVTREWMKSDKTPDEVKKKRQMLVHRMCAQYWELDPYIRGRGCYHRAGNIVGNGLVTFNYPSEGGGDDEWEVIGYKSCREQHLLQAEALARDLGIEEQGDDVKASKSSSRSGGGDDKTKKKKKKSSRA